MFILEEIYFPKSFFWGVKSTLSLFDEKNVNISTEEKIINLQKDLLRELSLIDKIALNSFFFSIDSELLFSDVSTCSKIYNNFIKELYKREIEPFINLINPEWFLSFNIDIFEDEDTRKILLDNLEKFLSSLDSRVQYYSIWKEPYNLIYNSNKSNSDEIIDLDKIIDIYNKIVQVIKRVNSFAKVSICKEIDINRNNSIDFNFINEIVKSSKQKDSSSFVIKDNKLDFVEFDFGDHSKNGDEYNTLISNLKKTELEKENKTNENSPEKIIEKFSELYDLPIIISDSIEESLDESLKSRQLIERLYKISKLLKNNSKILGFSYNSLIDHPLANHQVAKGIYEKNFKNDYVTLRSIGKVYSNIVKRNCIYENYLKYIE
ncbi:hypothetical protein PW5551_04355 [Petrotoga sp. 9PW.55.5.1]|uniref:hypothetical protein n=1 Tax=Petrotoga sp. 9PW.55.5.1 TaxID=1308979 RepID=UPI000DC44BB3|nr:hypothetical protein [Petrotoga sp. 9PW.55.5.1]RAO99372.1 hypothetical protein PW5551_04355 [Petrotoga sp. 9PW.55.5.1]